MEDNKEYLNRIIHERVRLFIMSELAVENPLKTFTGIRDKLKLTGGNLSVHLGVLEEAGYIITRKRFVNKKPQTDIRITDEGRDALENYLEDMEQTINLLKENKNSGGSDV